MKQYLDLLQTIRRSGAQKPGSRTGMPGSLSLFGYQFRHDLATGFPALTTKKLAWKSVVVELLWFLRGDTNIKYLVDNGCNIWNEDAYNYYLKMMDELSKDSYRIPFDGFVEMIKKGDFRWKKDMSDSDYKLGDCGHQYGKVWRDWRNQEPSGTSYDTRKGGSVMYKHTHVDQIRSVIQSLKKSPESRRHIVTAIDPAHASDLALYWCHAMFQFNCRPLSTQQRAEIWKLQHPGWPSEDSQNFYDQQQVPEYYLDCQMYQRSADVVLGVPFNIASYALLTHILAKICNMVPGHFIHTFGDVHIYDNHQDAVDTQLNRKPTELPTLNINEGCEFLFENISKGVITLDEFIGLLQPWDFTLENYNPQPAIKAELSTGLIK